MVFKREDLTKDSYTTGDVAKLFNVTPRTIQQWDRDGGNRRFRIIFRGA